MIPSIDTYLRDEIESKLNIILNNRYIIDEILQNIQTDVAENFKKAYFGESGREVPIIYTMPQEKVTRQGSIYIGLRDGEENPSGLGNIQDLYSFNEGTLTEEKSIVRISEDRKRLYMEVSEDIGYLVNVDGFSFAEGDSREIDKNRIYFVYAGNENLKGLTFNIKYVTAKDYDDKGFQKGYMSTEYYSVLAVSTNMDTVRCLDLIIKAIFILMRENTEEKNNYLLQNLQFGQIEEVETGGDSGDGTPEILYGKETIVSYKVTYSLDVSFPYHLENIELNEGRSYI